MVSNKNKMNDMRNVANTHLNSIFNLGMIDPANSNILYQGEDKTVRHTKAVNLLIDNLKKEGVKNMEKAVRDYLGERGNPVSEEIINNVLKQRGYSEEKSTIQSPVNEESNFIISEPDKTEYSFSLNEKYVDKTKKSRGQILNSNNKDLNLFEKIIKENLEKNPSLTLGRAINIARKSIKEIKLQQKLAVNRIRKDKMKPVILKTKEAIQKINFIKLFVVVSVVCFLLILNHNLSKIAQNGRYQKFDNEFIIDTRTGNVYRLLEDNGLMYFKPILPKDK